MLTEQEVLDARRRFGIPDEGLVSPKDAAAANVARRQRLAAEHDARMEQQKGFLGRAGEALGERFGQIKDTFREAARGDITPVESAVRTVGDVVASVGDVAGAALSPAMAKVAEIPAVKPAFDALAAGFQRFEEFKNSSESNRRIGEVVEGLLNIGEIAGAGAAGKTVARGAVDVAGRGAKSVAEQVQRPFKAVGEKLRGSETTKGIVGDVVPSPELLVEFNVTRALNLTQSDVKNITKSTGNQPGEWLAEKNLIRQNKQATQEAVDDFFGQKYKEVRDAISSVQKNYDASTVPRYKEALGAIHKQIEDVPGLEIDRAQINDLLSKKTLKLEDVQAAKELLDAHFQLFKATGDAKEGAVKEGIRRMRSDLREFIENEASTELGVDIRALNNDVSTARGISIATADRSTRALTKSTLTLADIGTFGTGTALANPLFGAALLMAKKAYETPTIRLRIARWVDNLNDAKKLKAKQELELGQIPSELPDEIKKSLLETGVEAAGAGVGIGVTEGIEQEATQFQR